MSPHRRTYLIIGRIGGFLLVILVGILYLTGSRYSKLGGYFAYMSVACTLIPLPTPPYVIGMGKVFYPGIVALVGALGNCIAAFVEYHFITWVFSKTELQEKIVGNRVFQKFARFFQRAAFACLVFTGFSAVPFEPFRFAAILIHYPMLKYLLSVFIGRFPRYYLVAMIGDIYQIPDYYLIVMVAVLIIIPVIGHYIGRFMLKRQKQEDVSPEDIEPTAGS
jgi:membrane protein YqaA with SNARE-associated domain